MVQSERFAPVDSRSLLYWQKAGGLFIHVAKSRYGIDLSPETQERWRTSMTVIKHIDTAVDDGSELERLATLNFLHNTFGNSSSSMTFPNEEVNVNPVLVNESVILRSIITNKQSSAFIKKGMQILRVEENTEKVRDVDYYARGSMISGEMAASLLTLLTEPEDRSHPNYFKLIKFMRRGTRLGSLVDEMIDLKSDKIEGKTTLEPNMRTRLKLARYAARDLAFIAKELGPEAAKWIPLAIAMVIKDKPTTDSEKPQQVTVGDTTQSEFVPSEY